MINLTNNQDIKEFALTPFHVGDDGILRGDPDDSSTWSFQEMVKYFGSPYDPNVFAPPIRTLEEMNRAIYALFWYRESLGLEVAVLFRRMLDIMVISPMEYMMCSENTQKLGDILTQKYLMGNCCDDRPMNFYPLLDNLSKWMDTKYGN